MTLSLILPVISAQGQISFVCVCRKWITFFRYCYKFYLPKSSWCEKIRLTIWFLRTSSFFQINWKERLKIKFNLWTACIHIRKVLSSFTVFDLNKLFPDSIEYYHDFIPWHMHSNIKELHAIQMFNNLSRTLFLMWSLCEVYRFKFWSSLNVKCIYHMSKVILL